VIACYHQRTAFAVFEQIKESHQHLRVWCLHSEIVKEDAWGLLDSLPPSPHFFVAAECDFLQGRVSAEPQGLQ
jgi:hypothetical protein